MVARLVSRAHRHTRPSAGILAVLEDGASPTKFDAFIAGDEGVSDPSWTSAVPITYGTKGSGGNGRFGWDSTVHGARARGHGARLTRVSCS